MYSVCECVCTEKIIAVTKRVNVLLLEKKKIKCQNTTKSIRNTYD